jgi:hypothetical protein
VVNNVGTLDGCSKIKFRSDPDAIPGVKTRKLRIKDG